MNELLGVTVLDLVGTMKTRRVRIPSEIGAFIALEVSEALIEGPALVKGEDLRIGDDGRISVFAPPGSATSEEAARSVVSVLGSLLVAAGTGVPRGLVGLLEKGPSSGRWDLPSLRDDLEASLVPLNRGAARRVLSRMLREVRKQGPSEVPDALTAPPPQDGTLDAQLDDLLGGEPAAAPSLEGLGPDSIDRELDATLDDLTSGTKDDLPEAQPDPFASEPPLSEATIMESSAPEFDDGKRDVPVRAPVIRDEPVRNRSEMTPTTKTKSARDADLDAFADGLDAPKRGSSLPWILAILAVLAATTAALALMRPDLVDHMLGRPPAPAPDEGPTEEDQQRLNREHRARFGTLAVDVIPDDAQIFMFIGRGPASAEELPLGMAIEFIAIADGLAPGRTVLPADAEWGEAEGGGRQIDWAIQCGTEEMAEEDLVLGETLLPRDVGSPSTELGAVRIITNPPGAKVYVLVGFAPNALVENVLTDEAVEMLVFHPEHPVARRVVGPSDWDSNPDGSKHAEISIVLEGAEVPEEDD